MVRISPTPLSQVRAAIKGYDTAHGEGEALRFGSEALGKPVVHLADLDDSEREVFYAALCKSRPKKIAPGDGKAAKGEDLRKSNETSLPQPDAAPASAKTEPTEADGAGYGETVDLGPNPLEGFRVLAAHQFGKRHQEFLIDGLVPANGLTFVYGEPKSGKSTLAVDLLGCVMRGDPWRGHGVKKNVCVLWVGAEDACGVEQRWDAWCNNRQLAAVRNREADAREFHISYLPLWLLEGGSKQLNLTKAATLDAIAATARELRDNPGTADNPRKPFDHVVVVIDTLSRAIPGVEENSAKDVSLLLAKLGELQECLKTDDGKFACTIFVIAHSGKDVNKGMRGSSAFGGAGDAFAEVSQGQIRFHWLKNAPEPDKPFHFQIVGVDIGRNATAPVAIEADGTGDRRDAGLAPGQRQTLDLIAEHFENCEFSVADVYSVATGSKPATIRGHVNHLAGKHRRILERLGRGRYRLAPDWQSGKRRLDADEAAAAQAVTVNGTASAYEDVA